MAERKKETLRVLAALAQDRRVVAADWRISVICVRLAVADSRPLPDSAKIKRVMRGMQREGALEPFLGLPGVFRVTVPFASILPSPQEVALLEANPCAMLSHFSAAAYHDLTNAFPTEFQMTFTPDGGQRLPLGTAPDDWSDLPEPPQRTPRTIEGVPVHWTRVKAPWDFGAEIGYVQGLPIYVTDLERTLLDAVRFPWKCNGIHEVLRIWKRAASRIRVNTLVDYVERFGQSLLKQRAGFLLERLGVTHPALDGWAASSLRGSSAKLDAGATFSSTFCDRWKLSLNVPDSALAELAER